MKMLIEWSLLMFSLVNVFMTMNKINAFVKNEIGETNSQKASNRLDSHPNISIDVLADILKNNHDNGDLELKYAPDGLQVKLKPTSGNRELKLSNTTKNKLFQNLMETKFEFKIVITLKQIQRNTGNIFVLSTGKSKRFLEIESNGVTNELRFFYLMETTRKSQENENFYYRLADNRWHQIQLIFYDSQVQLYIDCVLLVNKLNVSLNWDFQSLELIDFWVAQRYDRQSFFQGSFTQFEIVFDRNRFVAVCEQIDNEINVTGLSMEQLSNYVKQLTLRLSETEKRVTKLYQKQYESQCDFNGVIHENNALWNHNCNECLCNNGQVTCKKMQCMNAKCKNPLFGANSCCPICLDPCKVGNRTIEHGEKIGIGQCKQCECKNGRLSKCKISEMNETIKNCLAIACPKSIAASDTSLCCLECLKEDNCTQLTSRNCDRFASCHNFEYGIECECNDGFFGNGTVCEDIDECKLSDHLFGHECDMRTSECRNTNGSYYCRCRDGFETFDNRTCRDIDECQLQMHKCHKNARCENIEGSYRCKCHPNFIGNGLNCEENCNKTCLNGGICTKSNRCLCRKGYFGNRCENDIDECALNIHRCDSNSQCVNMPGWYYCKCKPGFKSMFLNQINHYQASCEDIDECDLMVHTCGQNAKCKNKLGSYDCECKNCTKIDCIYQGEIVEDGRAVEWPSLSNDISELITTLTSSSCKRCECHHGVIVCNNYRCDCSTIRSKDNYLRDSCCPECNTKTNQSCATASKTYENGQEWLSSCDLCRCSFGKVECSSVECPPVNCPKPILQIGDCCPRCDHDFCFSANGICAFAVKLFDSGSELIESKLISSQAYRMCVSNTIRIAISIIIATSIAITINSPFTNR